MDELVNIPQARFLTPPRASSQRGAEPKLEWIAVEKLRIARSYQRDILKSGLSNVRRIVEEFRWTRFAPLVVSRRGGGLYAVVDGQHRATAAAFLGIDALPCQVINCDLEEEATAFAAINGNVTKLSPLQVFNARLVAGDRKARLLINAVTAAGCIVPRSPQACDKPGMTLAIGTLEGILQKYGHEVLTLSLRMIVETGDGNAGMLKTGVVSGMADVIAQSPVLRRQHVKLKAAIDAAGVRKLYQKATRIQTVDGGPLRAHFAEQLRRALSEQFELEAA